LCIYNDVAVAIGGRGGDFHRNRPGNLGDQATDMLQINSGKLYQTGVGRTNALRGVLYTNLVLAGLDDAPIETLAGTLLQTELLGDPGTLVYQLTERLEDGRMAPGVLVSHGVKPYLNDFSYVVSFALNVTCTIDHDLTARLLGNRRSAQMFTPPSKLIKRVFDKEIWCRPEDSAFLKQFVQNLIGLRRVSFLAAMKAIRTYVTALHRVADDLELAYTLLVVAIESLAQGFGEFTGTWADFEESKRHKIDAALASGDAATADRVRAALVEIEHLALARRFREFALAHIEPSYYREPGRVGVLGPLDTRDALREAYSLRSGYVHALEQLPDMLSIERSFSESLRVDHRTLFTLEGLSRLARHIILEFVKRQPKVETEVYDYTRERFGIVQAEFAPEYWIGRPETLQPERGRKHLEAFLEQFAGHLVAGTPITTLKDVLPRIEQLLPDATKKQRCPLIVLYCLYNNIVPEADRANDYRNIVRRYHDELAEPTVEGLALHLLLDKTPAWPVTTHGEVYERYFDQRNRWNGFRMPSLFEAGSGLALAERLRSDGEASAARAVLKTAAENAAGQMSLVEFENSFDPAVAIDWRRILLPARTSTNDGTQAKP
jgi:hypothetical protein